MSGAGMKYVSTYMLIAMGGKEPDAKSMAAVLEAADCQVDKTLIDLVLKKMKDSGKALNELIADGMGNLESCGGGGGAPAAGGAAAGGAAGGAAAGGAAGKADAPPEEEEEEMEFDLFD